MEGHGGRGAAVIGLVIAAHGRLAREMVATAEQMVGPLQACEPVEIAPGTSPDEVAQKLREAVAHVSAHSPIGDAGVIG